MTATAVAEDVQQYKARWRSTNGSLTIFCLFLMALMLLPAAMAPRSGGWIIGAALCGGLAWLFGRPIFTGAWVLRIGPRGLSSYMLKGRTIPWRDIRDVATEVVQGTTTLVVTLAPEATESLAKTRPRLGGRKPVRRIALTGLKAAEVSGAVDAVQRAFAKHAGALAAAAVQARQDEARVEAAFEQDLKRVTPTTWGLYLVVALNVGVWLWNIATGMSALRPDAADLFRWGANSASAVTQQHEFWRLLTSTFLHSGVVHLSMNMLGLWSAGQLLNRLHGNLQFLLIYLGSALVGAGASLHFSAQTAVSVGASGAVFGVLGAVLVAAYQHRGRLPRNLSRRIMTSEGVFLVYALMNGFTRQGIDNAAHVGGLIAGAALAWLLIEAIETADRQARRSRHALLAGALLVVAIAALVVATPQARVDHRALFASQAAFQQILPRLQGVGRAIQKDAEDAKSGRMTEPQFVEALARTHLPALRALQAELAPVALPPGDPRAAAIPDVKRMVAIQVQSVELQLQIADGTASHDGLARMDALQREGQTLAQRMKERSAAAAKKKAD